MPDKPDFEQMRRLAEGIIAALREVDSELLAYQTTFLTFKEVRPQEAALFDVALIAARSSTPVLRTLHERYDTVLAKFETEGLDVEYLIKAVTAMRSNGDKSPN